LEESDRLAHLTGDLLELSRLQSSVHPNTTDQVALDEIVQAAISNHRVIAASRRIELVYADKAEGIVIGNANQLTSAISNLISNAINYSPDGSRVGVGIRETADQYEIAITDQGVGIPQADQSRIFERFYRVSEARDRNS